MSGEKPFPDPGEMVEGCIQQLKDKNHLPDDFKLSDEARKYIKDVATASLIDVHLSMEETGHNVISFIIGYRFHQLESRGISPTDFMTDSK
jgi:uncharacterized protein (UPF0297 family)